MVDARAFGRLLVVELGGSAAGAYCGRLFAGLGAEVVVVGDGPDGPGAGFYDGAKHRAGRRGPLDAADVADVVIQSSAVDPLLHPVEPAHPGQVVVRISPFAGDGPYRSWRSTDLVDAAIGGHLRLTGDPAREPLQGVPDLVHHAAGVTGFVGATAALIARVRTGAGQVVETSHQEVLAALHQFTLCRWTHNGAVLNRMGNRYAGPGAPIGAYRCADGWIGLALAQHDQVERMLEVTGLVSMLERPDVDSIWDLMAIPGLLDSELVAHLASRPRDETVELFQALRLPCAAIADLEDVLADPHLAERDFWEVDPVSGARLPGPPFHLSGHAWSGEPSTRRSGGPALPSGGERPGDLADGPLTGLRVLDLTRVWAGPLAARILADLGAEVLMVEAPWARLPREIPESVVQSTRYFPGDQPGAEPWNRSAFHNKYAINKRSTAVELDRAEGRELLAALVPTADVLIENYSPRVMPSFGFDEGALGRLNPDLVYVTMPGYGRRGPCADWVAYGPTLDGQVGHTSLTGYAGEGPWKCGIAWPDPIGGLHAAAAALVCLLDRQVEPARGGQTAEVAQVESAINMIGQHLLAAQVGEPTPRLGNRRPGRAPQGVYRCRGDDRWLAISVVDDRAWRALCATLGLGELAGLDAAQRWSRHDEIDGCLAAAVAGHDDIELMTRLQAAGVPAGAVLAAPDVHRDPQLEAIGYFVELDHPVAGTHPWPRFPGRLSLTPATMRSAAPLMGQHNEYAARDLAGFDEAHYRALVDGGVVRDGPPA